MNIDQQISTEIEVLRARAQDTQDLYREVCALLFFRYGITPTANKLYQYVRKGSMSAPAEALSRFWEELREKSRVRIEHPDLPEEVRAAAGDLVASLWKQAQAGAGESLQVFREEANATVHEANVARAAAAEKLALAQKEIDQYRLAAERDQIQIRDLERELSAAGASNAALIAQLTESRQQISALEASLAAARKDFAVELEKTREALQRSEERCEGTERRALLEIDRERTAVTRIQKELAQAQERQLESTESHRAEITRIQSEIGELRQKLGSTEGTMQELRALNGQLALQIQTLTTEASARETQLALLRRELELSQERNNSLSDEMTKLRRTLSIGEASTQQRRKGSNRPKE